MKTYLSATEVARVFGITARQVRRYCELGELRGAVKKKNVWRIPTTADERLRRAKPSKQVVERRDVDSVSKEKRDDALKKLGIIGAFKEFRETPYGRSLTQKQAIRAFTAGEGISTRTFHRWFFHYKENGILGLVDTRGK